MCNSDQPSCITAQLVREERIRDTATVVAVKDNGRRVLQMSMLACIGLPGGLGKCGNTVLSGYECSGQLS